MMQPIAVLFYKPERGWKNPEFIEVHEFDVVGLGNRDPRWLPFLDKKKAETGLQVGWVRGHELDAADAAIAYWHEEQEYDFEQEYDSRA